MAKLIRPSIAPRTGIKVSTRPLPKALIDTYYQSEADFRSLLDKIEGDSTFRTLVEKGVVRKISFTGRVPQHQYEAHKDEQMVLFFNEHDITSFPDWETDFFDPGALKRRHQLSKKYGVPVGELLSVLRYTTYVNAVSRVAPEFRVATNEDQDDFLKFTASDGIFDTAEVAERVRQFVDRYDLDQDVFMECFMGREQSRDFILERVHCSTQEIEMVQALVQRIQVMSSFCIDVTPAASAAPKARVRKMGPIAEIIRQSSSLSASLSFLDDGVYTAKFAIDETALDSGQKLSRDEVELLSQMRAMNQRKNVLHRLVSFLFRFQYRFFLTGNPLHMIPITQAAVAKAIFEEEATVSRLIRDKTIRTPETVISIKDLCRKTSATVRDLIMIREARELERGLRDRPLTDLEIKEILESEFGVTLSRRSITYHRNRCLKQSNYYSRVRGNRQPTPDGKLEGESNGKPPGESET